VGQKRCKYRLEEIRPWLDKTYELCNALRKGAFPKAVLQGFAAITPQEIMRALVLLL